jgi:hypothetical protein
MTQVKTAAQMFPLVESWQKSGLTQRAFSRKQGISEHVFCYWVARYRNAQPVKPALRARLEPTTPAAGTQAAAFIRLPTPAAPLPAATPVPPPAATLVTDTETVVELPSGVVLRFSGLVPASYLKELVGLSTPVC